MKILDQRRSIAFVFLIMISKWSWNFFCLQLKFPVFGLFPVCSKSAHRFKIVLWNNSEMQTASRTVVNGRSGHILRHLTQTSQRRFCGNKVKHDVFMPTKIVQQTLLTTLIREEKTSFLWFSSSQYLRIWAKLSGEESWMKQQKK